MKNGYQKKIATDTEKYGKGSLEMTIFSSSIRPFAKKYKDLILFDDKALERLRESLHELTF